MQYQALSHEVSAYIYIYIYIDCSRINQKVPEGPNPMHNSIIAWTDSLQNNQARINHDVPGGPNPINNSISAWATPIQDPRERINCR